MLRYNSLIIAALQGAPNSIRLFFLSLTSSWLALRGSFFRSSTPFPGYSEMSPTIYGFAVPRALSGRPFRAGGSQFDENEASTCKVVSSAIRCYGVLLWA